MVYTLTGFMGCGKTTYGREAARRAGCAFIDLDELIVTSRGLDIPAIFKAVGEAGFRSMEQDALMEAISSYEGGTLLIALGGGTLSSPGSRELVRACTHCIYLQASAPTIAENLRPQNPESRPKLAGPGTLEEKIAALLDERVAVYEAAADYTIPTDARTSDEIIGAIAELLGQ